MKIKKNFTLRQVAGTWVVLPLSSATVDFTGMLTLNDTGIVLWNMLENDTTREAMAKTPTLLGRAAEPIEVVNLITYLCSDQASFITGSNYAIDAGRACQHK